MKLKKYFWQLIIIFLAIIFASSITIACSPHQVFLDSTLIKSNNFFLDPNIQNSATKKHLIIPKTLQSKDLKKISQNLNALFHSKIISGGYGEERNFYKTISNKKTIHLGIDAIVKQQTPIISPANGTILASYWMHVEGEKEEVFANGIGGVVVAKYKIKDLNLPSKYKDWIYVKYQNHGEEMIIKVPKMVFVLDQVYYPPPKENERKHTSKEPFVEVAKEKYQQFLNKYQKNTSLKEYEDFISKQEEIVVSFIHLSKKTPYILGNKNNVINNEYKSLNNSYHFVFNKGISSQTPLEVEKGETIGYVGDFNDNGYWSPHVHINSYFYLPKSQTYFYDRILKYNWKKEQSTKETWMNLFKARPLGVKSMNPESVNSKTKLLKKLSGEGYFDPNTIFNLYDKTTEKVYLSFIN